MEPFIAHRHDGRIILEIDEARFVADAIQGGHGDLALVDQRQFAEFICRHLSTLTHDVEEFGVQATWWQRLGEALAQAAAQANCGVRSRALPEPTCRCDPDENDGG